jgi:hypothetical protein
MQTFDQNLMELVGEGAVSYETAMTASTNPADFELEMRTLRRRTVVERAPVIEAESGTAAADDSSDRPAGFSDDLSDILP